MKTFSLVVIGITSAIFSYAQSAKFGVKAGLNISNIDWDINTDSRLGLHGGLFAHIHLAPQWALQPELLYSAEGAKKDFGNGEEATYVNDYVNIPLMLQYMFNNGFRIEAGPQLGILTRAKIKDEDDNEEENDEAFKSTNVGLGFGLNYLSQTGFGIGGRYNLGLNKINEENFIDAKGRAFQISLFYMFDNNHKAKSK